MNTNTKNNEKCIDVCNSLLRGEISAVETYNKVIEKYRGEDEIPELIRIKREHESSVSRLRANVVEMGGTPSEDSGAWGSLTKAITSTANLFGEESAINVLRQGEEHGLNDYEKALENGDVMPSCKDMIRDELLPRVREHIGKLEVLGS
ncbi:DUF2383 domain-containing protein [Haloferula rosea]|uniref:DUF2383 domain-containing protein n=1 Tax=Haloferula rosea TaxID=490093 RepID=A0A934RDP1_9BACT|nr:DUF2383 domain-containing protein [Haloferula rosea]MBK1826671.1 DUF2383 domain-containing protein [Haloferula rosea]